MPTKQQSPRPRQLPKMKKVSDVAYDLRAFLADTNWETEREKIEANLIDLDALITELPFSRGKRKFSLEYKLARSAAEAVLPHGHALKMLLKGEGRNLVGSTAGLREARTLAVNLSAALGVYIALADSL